MYPRHLTRLWTFPNVKLKTSQIWKIIIEGLKKYVHNILALSDVCGMLSEIMSGTQHRPTKLKLRTWNKYKALDKGRISCLKCLTSVIYIEGTEKDRFNVTILLSTIIQIPPLVREVMCSEPSRVIPNTLKMAVMAALRVAGLALKLTGLCQVKWTSSTGNLPRKRHDISEKLLKAE